MSPKGWARGALLVCAHAATIRAAGHVRITLPATPVNATAHTLAVLGGAALLGRRRATTGALLYTLLSANGYRHFAPDQRRSYGYVVGFPVAAMAVGWAAETGRTLTVTGALVTAMTGHGLILGTGAAGFVLGGHSRGEAWRQGVVALLPGAMVKTGILAALLPVTRILARPRPAGR